MSFIDDIIDFGSGVVDFFTGPGIGSNLAKTALLGYGLNQITKSINRDNQTNNQTTAVDPGVRLQVNPDPQHKIPVVYGQTFLGGIVTDAQLTNSNKTMTYVLTICEVTGKVNLGTGANSVISFKDIYLNDERVIFKTDGITVDYTVDRTGTNNTDFSGLIKIYCYNNGSASPVTPIFYTNTGLTSAWNIMPGWTTNHTMNDLVFAIIKLDYNASKNLTSLPKIDFQISNTMTQPGDCIYDLMTNARYGAGIDPTEIYAS